MFVYHTSASASQQPVPIPSIDLRMSHSLEEGHKIAEPENSFNHLVDYETATDNDSTPKM